MRILVVLIPYCVFSVTATPVAEDKVKVDVVVSKKCTIKSANGDHLAVHLTGALMNGTQFDTTLVKNQPFRFDLGAGQVIKGLDQGLVGMCPEEKRKLTIPPSLGYGDRGVNRLGVPGGATLLYEVTLVSIDRPRSNAMKIEPEKYVSMVD